jgi:hypothetical protein
MNLKSVKIISFFTIIILSFLTHFMYDWYPSTLSSFFFPVNESIWEHMKILYTSIIFTSILEYFILKIFHIKFNNFFLSIFISSYASIIIYLLLYLPFYNLFGEKLLFSISLMIIVYGIVEILSYYILKMNRYYFLDYMSILFLIWGYIFFIFFTYSPPNNYIFYDPLNQYYGIKNKE